MLLVQERVIQPQIEQESTPKLLKTEAKGAKSRKRVTVNEEFGA